MKILKIIIGLALFVAPLPLLACTFRVGIAQETDLATRHRIFAKVFQKTIKEQMDGWVYRSRHIWGNSVGRHWQTGRVRRDRRTEYYPLALDIVVEFSGMYPDGLYLTLSKWPSAGGKYKHLGDFSIRSVVRTDFTIQPVDTALSKLLSGVVDGSRMQCGQTVEEVNAQFRKSKPKTAINKPGAARKGRKGFAK